MIKMRDRCSLRSGPGVALVAVAALVAGSVHAQPPVEELPAILQLQLDQQPAWRAYRDAAAESEAEGAHQAGLAAQLNALATPARLEALRQQLGDQQAAFEHQAAATVGFYAVLSPQQRHVFDELTRLPTPRNFAQGGGRALAPSVRTLRVPPPQAGLPPLAP